MKTCTKCKLELPEKAFGIRKRKTGNYLKSACKKCHNKQIRQSYQKNPSKRLKYIKDWREKNQDKVKRSIKRYRENNSQYRLNIEYYKEYSKNWKKEHPDKHCAIQAKRRASKLKATPPWLTEIHFKQMEGFYKEAARLTKENDILYEVDHIHPLQGKNACGLHVPWNLQILTKLENCSKSNKLGED